MRCADASAGKTKASRKAGDRRIPETGMREDGGRKRLPAGPEFPEPAWRAPFLAMRTAYWPVVGGVVVPVPVVPDVPVPVVPVAPVPVVPVAPVPVAAGSIVVGGVVVVAGSVMVPVPVVPVPVAPVPVSPVVPVAPEVLLGVVAEVSGVVVVVSVAGSFLRQAPSREANTAAVSRIFGALVSAFIV
jgi:hypothetical protein